MSNDFYHQMIVPYAAIIIKICRAYTHTQTDFEDYYQEVCLQIWRSHAQFKGKSQWSTWVYRIALNVCLTLVKKENKHKKIVVDTAQFPDQLLEDSQAFSDETLNALYQAIKQLSETDRAIILMHLEDHSHQSIASFFNTNANNIGVRILRIKKRLKKLLTQQNFDYGTIN